jgi:cytochrome oxidase assembly protein ShyY1
MVEARNEPHAAGWHVGKEIPLALIATFILTIAAQSFWLGMWVSSQNARVSDIEKTVSTIEKKLEAVPVQAERLARVETKTDGILASLSEIKETLRQRVLRQ